MSSQVSVGLICVNMGDVIGQYPIYPDVSVQWFSRHRNDFGNRKFLEDKIFFFSFLFEHIHIYLHIS